MLKIRQTLFSFFFLAIFFADAQAFETMQSKVDSVVYEAIRSEAFPGCVVLASKDDSVFFMKSYGYHTYDSARRVSDSDIYDLASLTKVVGGTLAMMKLYDNGYYNLDDQIGDYIDEIGRVGRVTFREALAHQGGLHSWIPFYKKVKRKNGRFKNKTLSHQISEEYPYPLSDSLYLHFDFYTQIKKMIRKSKISKEKKYRYSGLFFYLIPELVQTLTDTLYQDYLDKHFYEHLNAKTLTFSPLNKFSLHRIAPTEIDTFFRWKPIHGVVHDEGAIMMRGVSGNAGLFSNAEDLSHVFKMLLDNGRIDSLQLLKSQTVQLFTTAQYSNNENRRGLGFDKPLLQYDSIISSVAKSASFNSFGHTGYTGTLAWADPNENLVFVFLTNRVYPSRTFRALYKLNVRPTIHQLIYDYLKEIDSPKNDPVETVK